MPIITYIAPLSMTGSFYYRRADGPTWKNAGDLMMSLTLLMTLYYFAAIAWVVQETVAKNYEELTRPKEQYVQLEWMDHRQNLIAERCVLTWSELPRLLQGVVCLGAIGLVVVGHLFYWLPAIFFGSFQVNGDIDDLTWYGGSD